MEATYGGKASGRSCMLLGAGALIFAATGQFGWAFGTVVGAAGNGCFDS